MTRTGLAFSLAAAAMLASGAAATAQENPIGAELYRVSCAVCHGDSGQGDGEFSRVLTVKPPDLTVLTQNNDGVFPYLDVFQTVDGRTQVPAHGTRLMPIWGNTFSAALGEAAGPFGSELAIRAKIVALVDYVESLQKQ